MHSIWLQFIVFVLPVITCKHINVNAPSQQEVNVESPRVLRNGETSKRELMPSLRIRKGSPSKLQVPAGEGMTLECEAGGNPPSTIHWLKDGKRIAQSAYEAIHPIDDEDDVPPPLGLSFTRSRLFVDCVGVHDAGVYTCVAENSFKKSSRRTTVEVLDFLEDDPSTLCIAKKSFGEPARIHMWTHNRFEFIGSDVQLFCRSDGVPKPSTIWMTPNDMLVTRDTDKYELVENGDLIIHHIEWSDMGDYRCEVKNSQGSDITKTFLYPTTSDMGKRGSV